MGETIRVAGAARPSTGVIRTARDRDCACFGSGSRVRNPKNTFIPVDWYA
jgi:hypothetical protein